MTYFYRLVTCKTLFIKVFKTWIPQFSETRAFGDMVISLKGNQLVVRALPTVLTVHLKITYKLLLFINHWETDGKTICSRFLQGKKNLSSFSIDVIY